jgi:hypothetical protein
MMIEFWARKELIDPATTSTGLRKARVPTYVAAALYVPQLDDEQEIVG